MNFKQMFAVVLLLVFATSCGDGSKAGGKKLGQNTGSVSFPLRKRINVVTKQNFRYFFDLDVYKNGAVIIDLNNQIFTSPLHFREASPANNHRNGVLGDSFVLTDKNRFTRVLRYILFNRSTRTVAFLDWATNRVVPANFFFHPSSTLVGNGSISIGAEKFHFVLDTVWPFRIGLDQNADGKFDGEQAPIVDANGNEITEEKLKR